MDDSFITVVSGLPRSGTSMMMRMLDAGGVSALTDNVRKADDDNPRGYYEFEPVKRTKKDATWLEKAGGKVVKMVHLLLMDLPLDREYRVIFMRRNLEEIISSQDVMLKRLGKNRDDLTSEQLINGFEAQINEVDRWIDDKPNFKLLYTSYNEIIADPAPHVHKINEFLGGNLNTEAMCRVVDASLYRQRK